MSTDQTGDITKQATSKEDCITDKVHGDGNRGKLKCYFQNNETPTEDHFHEWLDSTVILEDDNIYIDDQKQHVGIGTDEPNATLHISSDSLTGVALQVDYDNEQILSIEKDGVNVSKQTKFAEDVGVSRNVTVWGNVGVGTDAAYAALQVQGRIELDPFVVTSEDSDTAMIVNNNNQVAINQDSANANLDVNGDGRFTDSLNIGEHIDHSAQLNIFHTENGPSASLQVQYEEHSGNQSTHLFLDKEGALSLGTNNPKAHFHILNCSESDIVRVDDQLKDQTPFIINNKGDIGIGTATPTNKLDIAGSVVIGQGYAGDQHILNDSLVVENKIGVNTINPEASVHIATRIGDTALLINGADGNCLVVTDQYLATDKKLAVKGEASLYGDVKAMSDLNVKGKTVLQQQTNIHEGLNVKGAVHVENELKVDKKVTVDDEVHINKRLTVHDDTDIKKSLIVEGNVDVLDSVDIKKKLMVSDDTMLHGMLGVDVDTVKATVHIKEKVEPALRIDKNNNESALVLKNGQLGLNTEIPEALLDVNGKAIIRDSLSVEKDTYLNSGLLVKDNAKFEHDAVVQGKLGVNINSEQQHATMHMVDDGADRTAFQIDHKDADGGLTSTFTVNNQLVGIGTDTPERTLDVMGDTGISENLMVGENLTVDHDSELQGNVKIAAELNVHGDSLLDAKLEVEKKATFKSNAELKGNLSVNLLDENNAANIHIVQTDKNKTAFRVDNWSQRGSDKGHSESTVVIKNTMLGINTDDPQKNLDVMGDGSISDNLSIGNNLIVGNNTSIQHDAFVAGKLGIETSNPVAKLHIADRNNELPAVQVDYRNNDNEITNTLLIKQGRVGIGTDNPEKMLDIKGDVRVKGDLIVEDRCVFDSTLDVAKDSVFHSDLTVKERTDLKGRVSIGDYDEQTEDQYYSQLSISDNCKDTALRIASHEEVDSESKVHVIVARQGNLGIGTDAPDSKLDVRGDGYFTGKIHCDSRLHVDEKSQFQDDVKIQGKLWLGQKADLGSDTAIKGELIVGDNTVLQKSLKVDGVSKLQKTFIDGKAIVAKDLEVNGNTTYKKDLTIGGKGNIHHDLHVKGGIGNGTEMIEAQCHIKSHGAYQSALLVEQSVKNGDAVKTLLKLDETGKLGIGTKTPQAMLDIKGNIAASKGIKLAGGLNAGADSQISGKLSVKDIQISNSIRLSNGLLINDISSDPHLGMENGSDNVIATQRAVKSYIDHYASPFGRNGQTITIQNQQEFEDLFGDGDDEIYYLPDNMSIILLPLADSYESDSSVPAYELKNPVRVASGVSIIGFNAKTTRVMKSYAECRFELMGNSDQKISEVYCDGWTFDGDAQEAGVDGAAFYLEHVENCQINCILENHYACGNGGAIYGLSTSNITALNIRNCHAIHQDSDLKHQAREGGAAYGLEYSNIHASHCSAGYGGAVAKCDDCRVEADYCRAHQGGGAAYRCERIRLTAVHCMAGEKGGGAYYCSDMSCEGYWLGNTANEANHIYANNNRNGREKERHYWNGNYIGKRINRGANTWRADNE